MAYSTATVASIPDVLAALITFATSEGWTVGGTASIPTFTPPEGGEAIRVQRQQSGNSDGLGIDMPSISANLARTNNPLTNGTPGSPDVEPPDFLHLHGGDEEGVSFIAGVIRYGNIGYRHFYLGGLVKIGTYSGGQAIAATWVRTSNLSYEYPADVYETNKFLFSGVRSILDRNQSGFAHIIAGAADSIRANKTGTPSFTSSAQNTLGENYLLGGAADGPNDALVTWGQAHYAASTLLVPINLYVTEGTPARLRPVGHPAGVRMVNMTNYDEAQQIEIGEDAWRVYPQSKKTSSAGVQYGTGWAAREASFYWGLAYPEGV